MFDMKVTGLTLRTESMTYTMTVGKPAARASVMMEPDADHVNTCTEHRRPSATDETRVHAVGESDADLGTPVHQILQRVEKLRYFYVTDDLYETKNTELPMHHRSHHAILD